MEYSNSVKIEPFETTIRKLAPNVRCKLMAVGASTQRAVMKLIVRCQRRSKISPPV